MKLPEKNRFAGGRRDAAEDSEPPRSGSALFLDVEGQVEREGDVPRAVTVFGVRHSFDAEGRVAIGDHVYHLVEVDGRACLAAV